ncbi:hypothetical protein MNBD_GAMMA09-610, partial [hydrothermal vent metagenome]
EKNAIFNTSGRFFPELSREQGKERWIVAGWIIHCYAYSIKTFTSLININCKKGAAHMKINKKIIIHFIYYCLGVVIVTSLIVTPYYLDVKAVNTQDDNSFEIKDIGRITIYKNVILNKEFYRTLPIMSEWEEKQWSKPWKHPGGKISTIRNAKEKFYLLAWAYIVIPLSIFISSLLIFLTKRKYLS